MKRIFRLFFGRFFWIALVLIIEIAFLVGLILVYEVVLSSRYPFMYAVHLLIAEILCLITMIYIVNSKKNSTYKISWLFIVGLFSYFGLVMYLCFANKSTSYSNRKKIAPIKEAIKEFSSVTYIHNELENFADGYKAIHMSNYISKVNTIGIYKNTLTTYFPIGEEAFEAMKIELEKAQHYIFIEYFIISPGKMWNTILDILVRKAKEGLDVRVIYDDVGSISSLPMNYVKKLKAVGIKAIAFNRFKPFMDIRMNNRDHRKIMIIDGYIAFTGGINLADEYINEKKRYGHWKDNAIMLKGEGVEGLTKIFLSTFDAITKNLDELNSEKFSSSYYLPQNETFESNGYVQPYYDLPFDEESVGERVYLNIINQAERYVYIVTPYLILSEEMQNALINACRRGVIVTIITPHIPDKKIVFSVTRSYYKRLLNAGVKIYEYTPGFVHSKMFISDDTQGTIGTINLDYRSLYLHLECGVYLYRTSSLSKMKKDFLSMIEVGEEITLQRYKKLKKGKTIYWAILRLLTPLL